MLNLTNKSYFKVINYFIFFIFFLIFVYAIYKSEFVFEGKIRSNYIFFYILSLTIMAISSIGILYKDKIPFLLFFVASFFFNLYVLEYVLGNKIIENYKKKKIDKDYDLSTFVELYEKNKNNLNEISFSFPSGYYLTNYSEIFPLASGQSNVNSYLCNESGDWALYKSDRYGFRNDDNLWKQKIDIVSVGDSFLHGYCVNEGESISEVYNKKSKLKMINLGVGGTGPLHQYARLIEYLKVINDFQYIFWFYQESNDLSNLDDEFENKVLTNYLTKNNFSQDLIFKQSDINEMTKKDLEKNYVNTKYTVIEFLKLDTLKWFVANYFNISSNKKFDLLNQNPISNEKRLNSLKIVLENAKALAKENNAKLIFVYTPYFQRYLLKDSEKNQFRLKNKVLELVKQLELNIIDIDKEVFEKLDDPLNIYPNREHNHPNAEGYELVANYLLNVFKKE